MDTFLEPIYWFERTAAEKVYAAIGEHEGRRVVGLYVADDLDGVNMACDGLTVSTDRVDDLVAAVLTLKEAITVDRIRDDLDAREDYRGDLLRDA